MRDHRQEPVKKIDFMADGYPLIGEPLNLLADGQAWFSKIYELERPSSCSSALVLGATPWMGRLLCRHHRRVFMVDMSNVMLQNSRATIYNEDAADIRGDVEFIQANWLDLPDFSSPLSTVLGDNSLPFVSYPDAWMAVREQLAAAMAPGAMLICRFFAAPRPDHIADIDALVAHFLSRDTINYTEVRAALMFANRDVVSFGIDTEKAVETFETEIDRFKPLFEKFPIKSDNDLLTIRKYRGSGVILYAPPLDAILDLLEVRFRIVAVHFGPYSMARCFPLVVAARR